MTNSFTFEIPAKFSDIFNSEYDACFLEFTKFLMSEKSVENILFYCAVDAFEKKPSTEFYDYINSTFVVAKSINEVNTSSQARGFVINEPSKFINKTSDDYGSFCIKMMEAQIPRVTTSITPMTNEIHNNLGMMGGRNRSNAFLIENSIYKTFSAFSKAKQEIFKLMERDSWARFTSNDVQEKYRAVIKIGTFIKKVQTVLSSRKDLTTTRVQIEMVVNFLRDTRKYKVSMPAGLYGIKDSEFSNITKSLATQPGDNELGW